MNPETAASQIYPDLPPDLVLFGNGPAQIKPVYDTIPPSEPAVQGMELGFNKAQSSQAALDYASRVLGKKEGVDVTVLSDRWSSSVVLEDVPKDSERQKVYKVFRNARNYPYAEAEMGKLTLLYKYNLAPKPYLLIDAGVEYRSQKYPDQQRESDSIQIARQDCGGSLPIIVMDKVEAALVDTMPDDQLQAEYTRTLQTVKELRLALNDTELVYDSKRQHVTFLDAGGIGMYDDRRLLHERELYQGFSDEQLLTALAIAGTLRHFLTDKQVPSIITNPQTFLGVMQEHTPEEAMNMSLRPLMKFIRQGPPVELHRPPNHWQPKA